MHGILKRYIIDDLAGPEYGQFVKNTDLFGYKYFGFLQWPRWQAVRWRLRTITRQFLLQAMPMF